MKKDKAILASATLLLASGALAHYNEPAVPDAYTGASQEVTTQDNLIVTADVSVNQITGVWGDATGIAAYNSEETLNAAGGKPTTDAIANGINEAMGRMGAIGGTLEFTSDGKFVVASSSNYVEGTYELSGSTVTIAVDGVYFSIKVSVKDNYLQLFYPVDKMPQQIKRLFADYNADGLYLGLQLTKK